MRYLILIEQEPLRRSAAAACTRAQARLDEARAGWHRFEREDKPAFARWRAREFGPLLSEAREVETRIRDAQALVHEVEMEMRRGFQNAQRAYERVMARRENPGAARAAAAESVRFTAAQPVSEFEQEALFQEWVHKALGTNPDKMDDEAYTTSFEAFKAHMFRAATAEGGARVNETFEQANEHEHEHEQEHEGGGGATAVDARVKELYRRLVRRLHPDLREDASVTVSSLWHEVQEAYAAGDVAQMEILLALSDIAANHMDATTSLGQMHALLAELERSARALEKSLLEARGEEAWNFARVGPDPRSRERIERELKTALAARAQRLDLLTRTIAEWAAGPMPNRSVSVRRRLA